MTISRFPYDRPFTSARIKLVRALRHIAEFDQLVVEFNESVPFKFDARRTADDSGVEYFMSKCEPVPLPMSAVVGDALHNMRSALDLAIFELATADASKTLSDKDLKKLEFPAAETSDGHESRLAAIKPFLSDEDVQRIESMQPYKDGTGHDLWLVHALDILDKHRLLVTAAAQFGGVDIGNMLKRGLMKTAPADHAEALSKMDLPYFPAPANLICPLSVGDVILTNKTTTEIDKEIRALILIALHEPDYLQPLPVVPVLRRLAQAVNKALGTLAKKPTESKAVNTAEK